MSDVGVSDQETANLYEHLVENASDVIGVLDERGVVTFVNSRMGCYLGVKVEDVLGHYFAEFVHPDDVAASREVIERALAGTVLTDFGFRLKTPDGGYMRMRVNSGLTYFGGRKALVAVMRDVTESYELNEKLVARNKVLAVLNEIALILSGPLSLDQALDSVLGTILSSLGLERGAILMRDSEGRLQTAASTDPRFAELNATAAAEGKLIAEMCMERGEPIIVPDAQDESLASHIRELARELGVRAGIAIPLPCGNVVKACLQLALPPPADMTLDQMEFVNLAARILGPAIENAALHGDLADQVNRLAMLERLARSINAGRDVHTVVNSCMREIADLIAYDLGVVVLLSDDGEAEVFPFSTGGAAQPTSRMELGLEQMRHVMSVDTPVAFEHMLPGAPFHTRPGVFEPEGGSGAAVPLLCMGRVFGLLKFWSKQCGCYGEREMGILESAAEHLSIAAHNARLYEAERRKSLELTAFAKEAQHRIRNNLQMISGLLSMSLYDAEAGRRAVERCLRQVTAISTVHDLLSPDDISARICLNECLAKIGSNALQGTGRGDGLELVVSGDACLVTADVATAVGVIVNELVSNAVEHGFRRRAEGRVEICVRREENHCEVQVTDDGSGLPPDFVMPVAPSSASGLGLMASLAVYGLGGTLEIERLERGTCARISMKGV